MRQLGSWAVEEWLSKQLKQQISKLLSVDWSRVRVDLGAMRLDV
jgi:hypothetical protein